MKGIGNSVSYKIFASAYFLERIEKTGANTADRWTSSSKHKSRIIPRNLSRSTRSPEPGARSRRLPEDSLERLRESRTANNADHGRNSKTRSPLGRGHDYPARRPCSNRPRGNSGDMLPGLPRVFQPVRTWWRRSYSAPRKIIALDDRAAVIAQADLSSRPQCHFWGLGFRPFPSATSAGES